ncbi:MAG: hypothetical protein JWO78_337 [Micavibrio sp.]|nr:hypothetical protein [Micavibrio sp.]
MMIELRAVFQRLSVLALRGGLPFTADKALDLPVQKIRDYLLLDREGFRRKQYFGIRIDYSMRVNFNSRPAVTLGFESRPEQKLVRKTPGGEDTYLGRAFGKVQNYFDEAFGRSSDNDEEIFHASQAVVVTDYKKAINRHGFAVMVYDRMTNYKNDLPVVFGLTAAYQKDGIGQIRRLSVPEFSDSGVMNGLHDLPVTEANIVQAMIYGRLCAEQVYFKELLTPRANWRKAAEIISRPAVPAPVAGPRVPE